MNDLISRDAVEKLIENTPYDWSNLTERNQILRKIDDLPDMESKKGIWQRRKGDDCWECSKCHAVLEWDDLGQHNFYFCYHCGADMRDGKGYYNIEMEEEIDGNEQ